MAYEFTSLNNLLRTFSCFTQIFFSPQVKRSAIISNKHGMYELCNELPSGLRLRILGN